MKNYESKKGAADDDKQYTPYRGLSQYSFLSVGGYAEGSLGASFFVSPAITPSRSALATSAGIALCPPSVPKRVTPTRRPALSRSGLPFHSPPMFIVV